MNATKSVLATVAEGARHADELLARAAGMVPTLRARERAAIEAGQVPQATIAEFADAGFFRVLQPARYGGYELLPKVYYDTARTLAEGCISSAWIYAAIAVHNWQMALFDDRAAQDTGSGSPEVWAHAESQHP